jgi:hypothetical protein
LRCAESSSAPTRLTGCHRLDAFNTAEPDRYLLLSDAALKLAARHWAEARKRGTPTADRRELDCDVILAEQALTIGNRDTEFVIATTNVGHLAQFAPADIWENIVP